MGEDYFHSTFADLILEGLVGIRPQPDGPVRVAPLAPATWPFFCADHVLVRGKVLTVVWDADGTRYAKGAGLSVFVDGKLEAHSTTLQPLQVRI